MSTPAPPRQRLVREGFGPTLPRLLADRGVSKRARIAIYVLGVVLTAGIAVSYSTRDYRRDEVFISREGLTWNARFPSELKRVQPKAGETFRIERRRGDLFVQAFAVAPIPLPGDPGEPVGVLPLAAAGVIDDLRGRYKEFELVQEGKARVNEAISYNISFQARLGERRLFGRAVIVPEQVRGAKRAQLMVIEATPAAGVSNPGEVGIRGVTKRPYRTFRLGTNPSGVSTGLEEEPAADSVTD